MQYFENKFKTDFFFEKIIILLIPFLFIFSKFFLELVLLYLAISFLIKSLKNKEFKYYKNLFFYCFSIFYLFISIRYFLRSEIYTDNSVLLYFRYGLYVLSLYYFLSKIKNLQNLFFNSVIFSFIILFIDTLIQYYFGRNIIGLLPYNENRMTSFFGDESILGSYIIHMFPFIFLSVIQKNTNYLFCILLCLISLIAILLSGERASLFLFLMQIIYLTIMLKEHEEIKKIIYIIPTFILICIAIISFNKEFKDRFINQTIDEMTNFESGINLEFENMNLRERNIFKNFYIFSGYHNNLILTSIEFYKSNKFFGIGPRGFKNLCKQLVYLDVAKGKAQNKIIIKKNKFNLNKHSCSSHPHNYYFQILAELGLTGLMLIVLFFLFIVFSSVKLILSHKSHYQFYEIVIFSFFITNFWPIITTGDFFNNWISIMIYLPFSFYLYGLRRVKNK